MPWDESYSEAGSVDPPGHRCDGIKIGLVMLDTLDKLGCICPPHSPHSDKCANIRDVVKKAKRILQP